MFERAGLLKSQGICREAGRNVTLDLESKEFGLDVY